MNHSKVPAENLLVIHVRDGMTVDEHSLKKFANDTCEG